MDILTYALAKNYTDKALLGIGTLKGAPCTVKSQTEDDEYVYVTLGWESNLGTSEETVVKIKKGVDGAPGEPGSAGDPGPQGVSITKIEKIKTEGLIDTYQISFSDDTTFEYTVSNGSDDYFNMNNKPSIEGVELIGNKTFEDLNIASAGDLSATDGHLQDLSDLIGDKTNLPMPTDTVVDNITLVDSKVDAIIDDNETGLTKTFSSDKITKTFATLEEVNDSIAIKKLSNEQSVLIDSTEITFTYDESNNWWKSDKNAITYQANLPAGVKYIVDIDNGVYVAEAGNNNYTKKTTPDSDVDKGSFFEFQGIGNINPLGWDNYNLNDSNLPFLIVQDFEENNGEVYVYLFPDKGLTITGTHTIKIIKSVTKYSNLPYEIQYPLLKNIRQGSGTDSLIASISKKASGKCAISLGIASVASAEGSVSLGWQSHATAIGAFAFGARSTASGQNAMAFGAASQATGYGAIALAGKSTAYDAPVASGVYSTVFGMSTKSEGNYGFAQGALTEAEGVGSHAEGLYTIATGKYQHAEGKYNIKDTENKYAHIIGGGTGLDARKNIHTVDWSGNAEYAGDVTATDSSGNKTHLLETIHKVYSMDIGNSAVDPVVISDFKIDPGYRYLYIINGSGTATYEVGILMFIDGMKFVPLSSSSSATMKDSVSAIGIHIYIENGQLKVSRDAISYGATCVIYKLG